MQSDALSRRAVTAALVVAAATFVAWTIADERSAPPHFAGLTAPGGSLRVERADTPRTRAVGLSQRDHVSADGLLLKWPSAGRHPIWMKGMRFGLDVAWLAEDGRVLALLTNLPPCDQSECPLYEPTGTEQSIAVLELPSHRASRYGIETFVTVQAHR